MKLEIKKEVTASVELEIGKQPIYRQFGDGAFYRTKEVDEKTAETIVCGNGSLIRMENYYDLERLIKCESLFVECTAQQFNDAARKQIELFEI